MATGPYTLLDLAARSGKDVVSIIEGVLTHAPEMAVVPAFPRSGLTYATRTNTELPSGDFAKVGAGVAPSKSAWKREVGSMCKFEAQMRVNEDIVVAEKSENADITDGDILADDATRTMQGSANRLGAQFWYGAKISPDGFAGLATQVDTSKYEVNAGGSGTADSSSVYFVYFDESAVNNQGVHFLVGNGGRMTFGDWVKQYVADPADPTKQMAVNCNHFLTFLGLVTPRPECIFRAKNVNGTANGFTDAVAAALLAKIPLALRQNKGMLKCFMNSAALYTLQASRATVNVATGGKEGVGKGGVFPEVPESVQGIEIIPTDSLLTTERAGLLP